MAVLHRVRWCWDRSDLAKSKPSQGRDVDVGRNKNLPARPQVASLTCEKIGFTKKISCWGRIVYKTIWIDILCHISDCWDVTKPSEAANSCTEETADIVWLAWNRSKCRISACSTPKVRLILGAKTNTILLHHQVLHFPNGRLELQAMEGSLPAIHEKKHRMEDWKTG